MANGEIREVDARGLYCPIPVLRLAAALRPLSSGSRVRLVATDPAVVADMDAFAAAGKARVVTKSESSGLFVFEVEKI